MAKPGSPEARKLAAMARSAADLGGGELSGDVAARLLEQAEGQLGMRCGGCNRRITVGFQFTRIAAIVEGGKPTMDVVKLSACNGDEGCDFAMQAREGATVMEMVEFVWLDEARMAASREGAEARAAE